MTKLRFLHDLAREMLDLPDMPLDPENELAIATKHLYALYVALDTLHEIDTEDIPAEAEQWRAAMDAGSEAYMKLVSLIQNCFRDLEEQGERAATVLDDDEDDEDSEDEV
jgi:hypothetical protein